MEIGSSGKEGRMSSVKLGVIGAGRIGQLHLDNVRRHIPQATVVALADIAFDHAKAVAEERDVPHVFGDPAQVFELSDVDAVLICSSTDTHAAFIEAAAEAGKHAFCEKPIALDLAAIDRAVAAADAAGIALQIGFNRRFDPNFLEARRQVSDGAVGDVHLLRITSRDPGPPPIEYVKVSGGLFVDMTIHDFDMARYIVGDEVEEVYAVGGALVDSEIGKAGDIDTAAITLRFRSGAIGVIDNSREAVYGYDQRLEVFGSGGMISVANPKPHTAVRSDREGDSAPPLLHFFLERYSQSFVTELRAFVEAAGGRGDVPVTGADGRAPVVMALAAQRSLDEGRPVRLGEIDA
jgi:myo-inositol 2-dehydrogenase/D-chiro-inositol 1-dehydrogenase